MQIRALNDLFRTTFIGGQVMLTPGISEMKEDVQSRVLSAVREFKDFDKDNDPYDEHDFGAVDIDDEKVFWKIDYYDNDLAGGSENPADPSVTKRVLTIMQASEY